MEGDFGPWEGQIKASLVAEHFCRRQGARSDGDLGQKCVDRGGDAHLGSESCQGSLDPGSLQRFAARMTLPGGSPLTGLATDGF